MKRFIPKVISVMASCVLLTVSLVTMTSAEIPTKPQGNANLISGAPTIPAAAKQEDGTAHYNYADATLSSTGMYGSMYYVSYPLDASLTAESSYVISVDMSITQRYDDYMGPAVIFRKDTSGNLLGLWFQGAALYYGSFTVDANGVMTGPTVIGNINNPAANGASNTLKIYSTPNSVKFSIIDSAGSPITLTWGADKTVIGGEHGWDAENVAGGAPAFGVMIKGTTASFANAEVYNTQPNPTSSSSSSSSSSVTEPTTTTTTKPPVDARPSTVPGHSGLTDLLTDKTPFRTAAEGYSYKDGVLTGTGDPVLAREFGKFAISGVSAQDTYLISLKMKISSHYDEYSGCYIGFRGADGKNFYAMGFQSNQVYLMNYSSNDYAAGNSFKVETGGDFTLVDGKEYQVDIFSAPTHVSLFVDGALVIDYAAVTTKDPMVSVLSANSNFTLSDIQLYNLSQAGDTGNTGDVPATGADSYVVFAVYGLIAAVAVIGTVSFRRRTRRTTQP